MINYASGDGCGDDDADDDDDDDDYDVAVVVDDERKEGEKFLHQAATACAFFCHRSALIAPSVRVRKRVH